VSENESTLSKVIRALIVFYGPATFIRAVMVETDRVIEDMAVAGRMDEAKALAKILEGMKDATKTNV
jgi:hypothetical protein